MYFKKMKTRETIFNSLNVPLRFWYIWIYVEFTKYLVITTVMRVRRIKFRMLTGSKEHSIKRARHRR